MKNSIKYCIKSIFLLAFLIISGCQSTATENVTTQNADSSIRAADMSFVPLILSENGIYKNDINQVENPLVTLQKAGCNYIRIRLWVNPVDATSSLVEVKTLALQVKSLGMKVWLCMHYSDTWADPGNQTTPTAWANLNFTDLKQAVLQHTSAAIAEIKSDIVQIGNEINSGLLWPKAHLYNQQNQSLETNFHFLLCHHPATYIEWNKC